MKKQRLLNFVWAVLLLGTLAANATETLSPLKQEKVYLHTDKPFYLIDDTLWFKGYLVDAQSHRMQDAQSRFLYVELINRKSKIVLRKKIKGEQGSFHNFMPLNHLDEGDYQLRAYTNFMQNAGSDFFFSRQIPIYAGTPSFFFTDLTYEREADGEKYVTIRFSRKDGSPFVNTRIEYVMQAKETGNRFHRVRTDDEGKVRLKLLPPEKGVDPYVYLTLIDKDLRYSKRVMLPRSSDYAVQFYPEGGHWIAGVEQQVAFKVETESGEVAGVKGWVMNERKDTLARIESEYAGIGAFRVKAVKGEQLYAEVEDGEGRRKRFPLPEPTDSHVALAVCPGDSVLAYRLLVPSGKRLDGEYGLMVHSRGKMVHGHRFTADGLSGSVALAACPEGIVHFSVFDKDTVVVSERLAFVRNAKWVYQMPVTRLPEEGRMPVKLGLRLLDAGHRPVSGSFSVSVTDNFAVPHDAAADNIFSHLLLSSDLRGYVHAPGYYFEADDETRNRQLDHLLLTHGWSRFNVAASLKGKEEEPVYALEREQVIKGTVRIHIGKKALAGYPISVTTERAGAKRGRSGYYGPMVTDAGGNFSFVYNAPQEGNRLTTIEVAGLGKKSEWRYGIEMEEMKYPAVGEMQWNRYARPLYQDDFMTETREGFRLMNGERVYQLPAVEVQALRLPKNWHSYLQISPEKIDQCKGESALDLLLHIPGLHYRPDLRRIYIQSRDMVVNGNDLRRSLQDIIPSNTTQEQMREKNWHNIRNSYKTVPVMLDGVPMRDFDLLKELKASDIRSIDLVRSGGVKMLVKTEEDKFRRYNDDWENDSIWEQGGGSFALRKHDVLLSQHQRIYISTYLSKGFYGSSTPSVARIGYLSYAPDAEFYAPRYPTQESRKIVNSDKRTTIHWEPNVRLNEKGEMGLSFYTADRPSTYTVVVEGVTDEGKVCRYVKKIE